MKAIKTTIPGLTVEQTQKILSLLDLRELQGKVSEVILFGSRAKGTHRPGSDIDLCLVGSDINFDDLTKIRLAYDELELPWTLDLVAQNLIQEPALLDHIDRVGVRLF